VDENPDIHIVPSALLQRTSTVAREMFACTGSVAYVQYMKRRVWIGFTGFALMAMFLTACASAGDLSVSNEGPLDVNVSIGDDEITVSPGGGVVILGSGCSQGDVIVEFESGQKVVVDGPICPDEQIVVHDSTVELQLS